MRPSNIFLRPQSLYYLLYNRIFLKYTYGKKLPTRFENSNKHDPSSTYFKIYVSDLSKKYFFDEKVCSTNSITRLEMVPLTVAENGI